VTSAAKAVGESNAVVVRRESRFLSERIRRYDFGNFIYFVAAPLADSLPTPVEVRPNAPDARWRLIQTLLSVEEM
jgi:hypothetical protein